ncbi:MAG TPA: glycosyltransferase family 9 protein [Opitutaceae bacterium]|jgi:ADP-heptose:LPS heptosyltransferase|nr:glycosyltransferase family 9 protein [Opitutaceae bacterium]
MIVVFKVNGLGDNVVFVPAVQALRSRFPDMPVTLVTNPGAVELYGGSLGPQAVVPVSKAAFNKAYRNPASLLSWALKVRRWRPKACLLSYDQGSVAHLLAKWSGAKILVGANSGNSRYQSRLSIDVPFPPDGCLATWNWQTAQALCRALGDTSQWPARAPAPDLGHLLTGARAKSGARRRVVVHPGAGKALTQWSAELFARVASSLSSDFEVVWIAHESRSLAPAGCLREEVATLAELAQWIKSADLFLGNNSGPMHLADALGCQGVAVAGASALGWDPYWHPQRWSVLRHPSLSCSPCEDLSKEMGSCANLESPMACMRYWTPAMVEAACRERLGAQPLVKP